MTHLMTALLSFAAALATVLVVVQRDRTAEEAWRNATSVPAGLTAPGWSETKWPFPLDQWRTGRAYRCAPATCGAEMTLYLRPKIGFCNCDTGVADDAEVDRVADVELMSDRYAPSADGRPVTVGWMRGRSRSYAIDTGRATRRPVLAIAFNDKCDVIVATVVGEPELPARAEDAALAFLNGNHVLAWAKTELGLSF
jgi:hypothetical protein